VGGKSFTIAAGLLYLWSALSGASAAAEHVRNVEQYRITWQFSEPARVGRYVTGDWWVVGPVTVQAIISISNDGSNRNGRTDMPMGNPGGGGDRTQELAGDPQRAELHVDGRRCQKPRTVSAVCRGVPGPRALRASSQGMRHLRGALGQ
jgi:hypothetical protein